MFFAKTVNSEISLTIAKGSPSLMFDRVVSPLFKSAKIQEIFKPAWCYFRVKLSTENIKEILWLSRRVPVAYSGVIGQFSNP